MPLTMDIFNDDAFHMINMTETLNYENVFPSMLRSSGLFTEEGVETHDIMLEEMDGRMDLVQTSARYSPPTQTSHEKRRVRKFTSVRLSREAHVNAGEVQSVRSFGTTTELESLQSKANQRVLKVQREIDATIEHMMLGALQGVVLDADGTQLFDWYDELGVTALAPVNFDFSVPGSDGRFSALCREIKRRIHRVVSGMNLAPSFGISALCGDGFYDQLIKHEEVRETFLNWEEARNLRNDIGPFDTFRFGNINFINYMASHDAQGTKDAPGPGTVAVADNEARFYPTGVDGLFKVFYTPADVHAFANTPGLPSYVLPKVETMHEYSKSAVWEVQSNPLVMCKRPRCLLQGLAT